MVTLPEEGNDDPEEANASQSVHSRWSPVLQQGDMSPASNHNKVSLAVMLTSRLFLEKGSDSDANFLGPSRTSQ